MRLVLLADIHGHISGLDAIRQEISQADAVLIAGDITHFGGPAEARAVLDPIAAIGRPVLAVHGNCDTPEVGRLLAEGDMGINGRLVKLGDISFVGVGGSLVCSGRTPCEQDEDQFEACLHAACQGCEGKVVLVTHQPPYGTRLDLISGRHGGSTSIRRFIEDFRPVLAVCGHFHEAVGVDTLGQTTIVNPGPFKSGRFAVAQILPDRVKVEARQFRLPVEDLTL
ncbi:MAG: metallophosphoesterase family protein [Sedimentisphaerales bacterium]|nr:metallophosphoesterase family protein [Sedimentisphaerales bacterium]